MRKSINNYWATFNAVKQRAQEVSATLDDVNELFNEPGNKSLREQVPIDDIADLLSIYEQIPVPRVPAGESGQMFMNAILRMIDGMTEAVMLIGEAVHNIAEFVALFAEAAVRTKLSTQFGLCAEAAAAARNHLGLAALGAFNAGGAMQKGAHSFQVEKVPEPYFAGAGMQLSGTVNKELGEAAVWLETMSYAFTAISGHETVLSGNSTERGNNHTLWQVLDCISAAIKIAAIVIDTLSWAMQVIGVPVVPELPLPICGWDIIDPYWWEAGTETSVIIPEDAVFIDPPGMSPPVIAQGGGAPPLPEMPEQVEFEYPEIGFLGTYQISG